MRQIFDRVAEIAREVLPRDGMLIVKDHFAFRVAPASASAPRASPLSTPRRRSWGI